MYAISTLLFLVAGKASLVKHPNSVGEFVNLGLRQLSLVGEEPLEGDKRAVCEKCRYGLAKSCKNGEAIQEQLLKRKHPISPLSSNNGDKLKELL